MITFEFRNKKRINVVRSESKLRRHNVRTETVKLHHLLTACKRIEIRISIFFVQKDYCYVKFTQFSMGMEMMFSWVNSEFYAPWMRSDKREILQVISLVHWMISFDIKFVPFKHYEFKIKHKGKTCSLVNWNALYLRI